jgi:hypothetical protein
MEQVKKIEKIFDKKNIYIVFFFISITGLTAIVTSNCTDKNPYFERDLAWTDYINPCALLLLYFYFAFETNRTLFQRVKFLLKIENKRFCFI